MSLPIVFRKIRVVNQNKLKMNLRGAFELVQTYAVYADLVQSPPCEGFVFIELEDFAENPFTQNGLGINRFDSLSVLL